MTAPTNTSLVCPISLNSTILILFYLYPKCCGNSELFSSTESQCVSLDSHLQNKTPSPGPDLTKSQVDVGFPCFNSLIKVSAASLSCDDSINRASTRNATNPWNGEQYCWDIEKQTLNSILITEKCYKSVEWCISFFYCISLVLVIITFFLYAAEPQLRKKVKDKCFICYLVNLTFMLMCMGDHLIIVQSYFMTNPASYTGVAVFFVCVFICLSSFSWLNVMCIHMWRTVRTMSSLPERSFNVYAWYALGLPFISFILPTIDLSIHGIDNFLQRVNNGSVSSNPMFLYFDNIVAVQLIINILIFCHVGYIIWNQKQQWSGNENSARNQRLRQDKNMFSKLLRLFIIMGLDWISLILALFYNLKNPFVNFFARFAICPGYLIFITYVVRDERVIPIWKNRVGY